MRNIDKPRVASTEELLKRYASGERDFAPSFYRYEIMPFGRGRPVPMGQAAFFVRGAKLSRAKLANQDLKEVDLRHADLDGAKLGGTNLTKAHLTRANLSGADLVTACLCGATLDEANLEKADFTHADLTQAKLSSAKLKKANLYEANLSGADLRSAQLRSASLNYADLSHANLSHADLSHSDLNNADLSNADLSGADLSHADFSDATLVGIRANTVKLSRTLLLNVDISSFCDAEPGAQHHTPSLVDFRTILRSLRSSNLKRFLQQIGMPEIAAEYMIDCARSLDPQGIFKLLQSTFISYGGPDTDFARKLNDALLKNGVTTFFFPKDAIPGKKLHRLIRDGVNQNDRVILVCSKASLDRPGVLSEITETLQREARDGGKEYLIPITLDDYVFFGWKPEDPGVAQAIRDRVVADFRGAEKDKGVFDAGVLKLIGALKK